MNTDHIQDVLFRTFTHKPEKINIEQNVRLSNASVQVFDISLDYIHNGSVGVKSLYIQLRSKDSIVISGISCQVKVSNDRDIRFDFSFDTREERTYVSIFYNRKDNVRFVVNVEIDQSTIIDLISNKKDLLINTINQSKQYDVMRPGVLDAVTAQEEEVQEMRALIAEGFDNMVSIYEDLNRFSTDLLF